MSLWRPSVQEERWLALAARLRGQLPAASLETRCGGWRRTGPLARIAFAVLGLVAAGCAAGILGDHSDGLFVTGFVLLVTAECLILIGRLFASGIEEALEVAGLFCIGAAIVRALHGAADAEWVLLATAVFAIAGLRLLNPLLTTLAVVAAGGWLAMLPLPVAFDAHHGAQLSVNLYLLVVALAALACLAARIRRPSQEQMFQWLVALLPLVGLAWLTGVDLFFHVERSAAGAGRVNVLLAGAVGATAVIMLVVGLRRRSHAPLMSFMGCVAHLAWQLRGVSGLSLQSRLLLWGMLILIGALLVNRYLREPRRGVTSEPMTERSGALALLQLVGTSALTEQAAATRAAPEWTPGGGRFGGSGASGGF